MAKSKILKNYRKPQKGASPKQWHTYHTLKLEYLEKVLKWHKKNKSKKLIVANLTTKVKRMRKTFDRNYSVKCSCGEFNSTRFQVCSKCGEEV